MVDKGILYDDAGASSRRCSSRARCSGPNGNVGDAAELLGMHRNTLARKMAEYRIRRTA